MNPRIASPALADRGARLAGVGFTGRLVPREVGAVDYEFPAAQASQAVTPCAVSVAPSGSSPGGAAFSYFTESCSVAPVDGQDIAPAVVTPTAGAVTNHSVHLPEHVMVAVNAIAAYEQCSIERAVVLALVDYGKKIGAGPLARAVADMDDEFAEVPAHARLAANRFRGGGP